jgi:glycerate kinase
MKILLAPDSFKGSMSSIEVINCIEKAAKRHFNPLELIKLPIADGGEGTVDALTGAKKGQYKWIEVKGPLGDKVKAKYGIIKNKARMGLVKETAVIEMAQASGLPLIETSKRNPLLATTYGTGEIIKAALDKVVAEIEERR